MIRVALNGALGKMGQRIALLILKSSDFELMGVLEHVDHLDLGKDYGKMIGTEISLKVTENLSQKVDVMIDFSLPKGTMACLEKCVDQKIPLVSGTTGCSPDQLASLKEASKQIPILHATNMSMGITLLRKLVRQTATSLGEDFDIELVELHHKHKVDAPSGTCITLYEDICHSLQKNPKEVAVYGRQGKTGARTSEEIGLHALRLGGVVGDHTVYFCSEFERIEIRHQAHNRDVFAGGALRGAKWIVHQEVGFYSMEDVLFGKKD